jgi:hypothetical protein
MLKQHAKCMKKNIRKFVMAEWDRLVEHCSNDLPVFVSEKQVNGAYGLCFCCADLPSMEVIILPCCKASAHRHCVLEAIKRNDQCVYCRQGMEPQDIIDCTPQPKAYSGDTNVAQTTTGDTNMSLHTSTVPGLKAPPEAKVSQEEVAVNMNPPNIHSEPPVHNEVMNLHKKPVDGQKRCLSSMSIVGENDNNGLLLLFAPTCSTHINENKFLLISEKNCSHQWTNESLTNNGKYIIFLSEMYHHGYYNQKSNQLFIHKRNYSVPQPMTLMSYDSHNP